MRELINASGKMTSIVIAEITGKNHSHLMRDIRKMEETWVNLGQSKFGLISYTDSMNREKPMYELTKTECLYIATKFNDEARAKLVLRWEELELEKQKPMSTLDMLEMAIKNMRANQQELDEVKQDIREIKAKTITRPDYFTIAGYGSLIGIPVSLKIASQLGRAATRICIDKGLPMDDTPDPRFGKVKMYPRPVLDEVFNMAIA